MKRIFKWIRSGYAFEWGLVAIAFCLPFYRILSTSLIAITAVFWLSQEKLGYRLFSAFKNRYFLLFLCFYVIHIASYFLSFDKKVAGTDLETKLSLIVFPLFFYSGEGLKLDIYKRIARAFVWGCLTAIVFCVVFAIYNSFNNPNVHGEFNISIFLDSVNLPWWQLVLNSYSYFNYAVYSHFLHPSYFALYLTFTAFIVSSSALWYRFEGVKGKVINILIVAVLILNIFLLQSRAGLIALFVYLIWLLIGSSLRVNQIILALSGLSVIIVLILFSGRFELVSSKINVLSRDEIKGTNLRVSIWYEAIDLINEKPILGHGIGDAKKDLLNSYQINGLEQALKENLNVHNDFLEVGVKLGLIGLLLLLIILSYPLFAGSTNKSIYLFFFLIIGVHFLFESMLERYAGVGFFSFFYCFINSGLRIIPRK